MLWFIGLLLAYLLMALSNRTTGHPLAFIGIACVGFCFSLLGGVVLKALGLT